MGAWFKLAIGLEIVMFICMILGIAGFLADWLIIIMILAAVAMNLCTAEILRDEVKIARLELKAIQLKLDLVAQGGLH
jgi:hypothetical protein